MATENPHTPSDAEVHLHLAIPHSPRAARVARFALRALDSLNLWDGHLDDVELMVSELATNAYDHTRGPMLLQVYADQSAVRVEIRDSGGDTEPATPLEPEDDNGRGLKIVAEIVKELGGEWGVDVHRDGHTVWFGLKTS